MGVFRSVSLDVIVGTMCKQLCGSLIPTRRKPAIGTHVYIMMRAAELTVTEIPLKVCCQSTIH